MSVTYEGGGSIGTLLPMSLQAVAALDASIALMLPELAAKLAGALEAQLALSIQPPSLSASIELVAELAANLAIAISGPSITVDFSAIASLIAEIQASLGALQANLALALGLKIAFGHAGLHLYTFEGQTASWGPGLSQSLADGLPGGGPDDEGYAFMVACNADPGTVSILKALLGQV